MFIPTYTFILFNIIMCISRNISQQFKFYILFLLISLSQFITDDQEFSAASHRPWQLQEPVLIYEASSHFNSPLPPQLCLHDYSILHDYKCLQNYPSYTFIPTYTFIIFFKVFLPTCLFPPTLIFGTLEQEAIQSYQVHISQNFQLVL